MEEIKTSTELIPLYADVKYKSDDYFLNKAQNGDSTFTMSLPAVDTRGRFDTFSGEKFDQLYATLNSGATVPMYESYIPGTDNNERLARAQTSGEKWSNGWKKFRSSTWNAILGGTVGAVNGIIEGVTDWNFEKVYDNNFSRWIDDRNTENNYRLPNLYTKQETEKGVFGQMGTTNFWADKVLGGLSFTVGAIVSESMWLAATGGAGNLTRLATRGGVWAAKKLGKETAAKGIAKYADNLKEVDRLVINNPSPNIGRTIALGRAKEIGNTLRFTWTSAGHEASVEALQFKKEQEELFMDEFLKNNGRVPTTEEMSFFKENLDKASNGVFSANMFLVGSSNILTIGNIVGLRNPMGRAISNRSNKLIYGVGRKVPNKVQKANRYVFPLVRNMGTEGLYEEGGQAVSSNVAGKWMDYAMNEEETIGGFDMIGALFDSMSEQYATEEGWKENMVGMIIGLIGEAGTGNTRKAVNKAIEENRIWTAIDSKFTAERLGQQMMTKNRIAKFNNEADQAQNRGDLTEAEIAKDGVIISYIDNRLSLGHSRESINKDISTALKTVTQEQLEEQGIDQDIDTWRQEQYDAFNAVSETYSRNRTYAEYVIGKREIKGIEELRGADATSPLGDSNLRELLVQSLAFTMTAGNRAGSVMNEMLSAMRNRVGATNQNTINTLEALSKTSDEVRRKLNAQKSLYSRYTNQRESILRQIQEESAKPDIEGDKTKGSKILSLTEKLNKVDAKIAQVEGTLAEIRDTINSYKSVQESYQNIPQEEGIDLTPIQDFNDVSVNDLLTFDESIQSLNNFVNSLENIDPQQATELRAIVAEYESARKLFGTYHNTIQTITKGDFTIDKVYTLLGKKFAKDAKMDSYTRDWMADMLQTYSSRLIQGVAEFSNETGTVSSIEAQGELSTELVANIIRTGVNPNNFTGRLLEYYNNNKQAIDEFIKREPLPEVTQETEQPTETRLQYLQRRLQELLKKAGVLDYIGDDVAIQNTSKPTQAEIEEYQTLLRETDEGSERLDQLRQQLSDWKVLDSFVNEEGLSIADMVELINQLEEQTALSQTVAEIPSEDALEIASEPREFNSVYDGSIAQNTNGDVTAKFHPNGTISLHHLNVDTISQILGGAVYTVTRKGKQLKNIPETYQEGDVVNFDGLTITVGRGLSLVMDRNEFSQTLPFTIVSTNMTDWSYHDVYLNGRRVESDFLESDIDANKLYDVKENDIVRFEVDKRDPHTLQLLEEYLKNPDNQQAKLNLLNGVKVYVVHNGARVSFLKGQVKGTAIEDIRQKAFEAITSTAESADLGITTRVNSVFIGTPSFFINSEATGIESRAITTVGAEQVLTTGYIENGEVTLAKSVPQEVNRTYVYNLSTKYANRKLPIAVVKRGDMYVAIPLELNTTPLGEEGARIVDDILANSLDSVDATKKINEAISTNNIPTEKLIPQDLNDETLERVKEAFRNKGSHISAEELASPEYNKEQLASDARTYIDLEDLTNTISNPKLRLDLDMVLFDQDPNAGTFDNMVYLEDSLNEIAKDLDRDIRQNSSTKYSINGVIQEDNKFIQSFDDGMAEGNSHLDKLKNINVLREAFSTDFKKGQGKFIAGVIGQNTINKVNILFRQLDLLNPKPTTKDVKEGENNTKC